MQADERALPALGEHRAAPGARQETAMGDGIAPDVAGSPVWRGQRLLEENPALAGTDHRAADGAFGPGADIGLVHAHRPRLAPFVAGTPLQQFPGRAGG